MGLFQYIDQENTEKSGICNMQFLVKEQVMLHFRLIEQLNLSAAFTWTLFAMIDCFLLS